MNPLVPKSPVVVALYKGTRPGLKGKLITSIGKLLDHGPYTHTEIILFNDLSYSASLEDGGVRAKKINYSTYKAWDFIVIPQGRVRAAGIKQWFDTYDGKKYDIMGNIRFLTNLVNHDEDKWFCSETTMASLDFPEPFRYGPNGCAKTLSHHFNTPIIVT